MKGLMGIGRVNVSEDGLVLGSLRKSKRNGSCFEEVKLTRCSFSS